MIISIIGTAGRGDSMAKLSPALYQKMVQASEKQIVEWMRLRRETWADITLKSGGAAVGDHQVYDIATLHPECKVDLRLPSEWDWDDCCFSRSTRDGQTANYYHGFFSRMMGRNTLAELQVMMGSVRCSTTCYSGFKVRNVPVSVCDGMIAHTWGIGNIPADGGTAHTWGISKAVLKKHIALDTL